MYRYINFLLPNLCKTIKFSKKGKGGECRSCNDMAAVDRLFLNTVLDLEFTGEREKKMKEREQKVWIDK